MEIRKYLKSGCAVVLILLTLAITALPVQAAKLSKKSVILLTGKSCTIKLRGIDQKVTWKTTKRKVLKIKKKKKTAVQIKAVKKGKAILTARVKGRVYKCRVQVVDPKLNKTKLSLTEGQTGTLKTNGGAGKVVWKSSDREVASVNNGKVTAKKAGTATVTAIQNKRKMTCMVQVADKVEYQGENQSAVSHSGAQPQKVWVVTKRAETVYIPIYDKVYYIECLTCGATFEGENQVEEYVKHESAHMDNGEEGRYTTKVRKTLIRTDTIYYPEEGYWKDI